MSNYYNVVLYNMTTEQSHVEQNVISAAALSSTALYILICVAALCHVVVAEDSE